MTTDTHPAIRLGKWVKEKRRAQKLVASRFAGDVGLTPAQYAEFECGVGSWLTDAIARKLFFALRLHPDDSQELNALVSEAKDARPLAFGNVFTREQLKPMRLRSADDSQVTLEDSEMILDQVFAPLETA